MKYPQELLSLKKKIREHDKSIYKMPEYECNISMLEILFGKDDTKKMFPDGEKTNLDKLALCTRMAIALYMTELHKIEAEDFGSKIK